jgi:hypothetical protein
MILYEVTVTPEAAIATAFETYMREKHIREVLDTGCFTSAQFAAAPAGKYRTSYSAATQEQLDRYLQLHASRLRDDFAAHFPSGMKVGRETWQVVEQWQA